MVERNCAPRHETLRRSVESKVSFRITHHDHPTTDHDFHGIGQEFLYPILLQTFMSSSWFDVFRMERESTRVLAEHVSSL